MKLRLSLLAAASSIALVGALAAPAGAATTVDVSNDTITCNSVVGTIKFSPALQSGGTSAGTVAVKTSSGGCTTGSASTTILNGASAGTLTSATNDCAGLLGLSTATSGNLVVKYKTATGSPKITPAASTFHITQSNGTTYSSDTWGASYGEFQIGGVFGTSNPSVTGAFTGGNSGHTSTIDATTGQSDGELALACLLGGIKGLSFGIGGITLQ